MLDYSRFATGERGEEDHTRIDGRSLEDGLCDEPDFDSWAPSSMIEEGKGGAAWHSDACVVLGLIGHGIRANKHRAGGLELECTLFPTDQGVHSDFIKAKTVPK